MFYAICFSILGAGLLLFIGSALGIMYFRKERAVLAKEASRRIDMTMDGLKRQGLFAISLDMGHDLADHLNQLPYLSATFDDEIGLLSFDLDGEKKEYFDQYSKGEIDEIILKAMEFDRLKEDTEKVISIRNDAQTVRAVEKMKEVGISPDRLLRALLIGKKFIDKQRMPPEWGRASEGDKKALQRMDNGFDPFAPVTPGKATTAARADYTHPPELVESIINGDTEHDEYLEAKKKEQMEASDLLQATTGLVTFRADGEVTEGVPAQPHKRFPNGLLDKPASDHDSLGKEKAEKLRAAGWSPEKIAQCTFFIDVNDMDKETVKKVLARAKKNLEKRKIITPNGEVTIWSPLESDEDFFIATTDQKPGKVEKIGIPEVDLTKLIEPHPHCDQTCCDPGAFDKWYSDACDDGAC